MKNIENSKATQKVCTCSFCRKTNVMCFVIKNGIAACVDCDYTLRKDAEADEANWYRMCEY